MARITIDGDELVVTPSLRERRLIGSRQVRLPLAAVMSAEVQEDPWRCLRGKREHGLAVPEFAWVGVWEHPLGRDLVAVRPKKGPCVQVELLPSAEYVRVALTVPNPQGVVDRLRAALRAQALGLRR
jgi:hypothetical protein